MMKDCYGNTVTTTDSEIIDSINQFSTELVRLGREAECILGAVDRFADSPLVLIYGAFFHLFGQTEASFATATNYLKRAEETIESCSEREKSLWKIGVSWSQRCFIDTLKELEAHCRTWPTDLVAIKTCEYHYYCNGQQYQSKRFLDLTQSCMKENEHLAHFLSMHAFAHELCGNYNEAEKTAEKSLDIDSENPWAQHCLSHLYINRGDCDYGVKMLEEFSPAWKRSNRMIESHNMWHLALLYLEQRDFDKVLETYSRAQWKNDAVTIGEEVDVAALLWRLDMEGYEVNELWENLGNAISNIPPFPIIPFINVQLCYALKRANREQELNQALESIQLFVDKLEGANRYVWEEVGLPLLYGSLLYADGEYDDAAHLLEPIIDYVGCVGGSDAQIALFQQTYFKSLVKSQKKTEALKFLNKMLGERTLTPLELSWKESC